MRISDEELIKRKRYVMDLFEKVRRGESVSTAEAFCSEVICKNFLVAKRMGQSIINGRTIEEWEAPLVPWAW